MLNAPEIIGFLEPGAEGRFELVAELRRQRQAEIARITAIAMRLAARFDAETGRRVSPLRDPRATTRS